MGVWALAISIATGLLDIFRHQLCSPTERFVLEPGGAGRDSRIGVGVVANSGQRLMPLVGGRTGFID